MVRTATLLFCASAFSAHAQTTHELMAIDFEFVPAVINAVEGDSLHIVFQETSHTFTQVSEETWNANGTEPDGSYNIGPGTPEITLPLDATGTIYYVCLPHASMGMKGIINVMLETGIAEVRWENDRFYPNPANDRLWMREPAQGTLDVFFLDASGRDVQRTQVLGNGPLSIGDLRNGLYVVRVADGGGKELYRQLISVQH